MQKQGVPHGSVERAVENVHERFTLKKAKRRVSNHSMVKPGFHWDWDRSGEGKKGEGKKGGGKKGGGLSIRTKGYTYDKVSRFRDHLLGEVLFVALFIHMQYFAEMCIAPNN